MHHDFPIDPDSIIETSSTAVCDTSPAEMQPQPFHFPKASSDCRNENYALMLRSCFCGRDSELSSAICYLYQSIRFSCCSDELCTALYDMAMRRFKAAKLLGDLICSLGSDPKFFCGKSGNAPAGSWWNASPTVLRYPQHIGDALQTAIRRERAMAEEYKSFAAYIDDVSVCRILEQLRSEKLQDIHTLTLFYTRFCS